MKNRVHWIDTIKGIGMLLVIFGHFFSGYTITNTIYIFHIPLFFIVSGYLFNIDKDFRTIITSKLRGLVLPYFSLGIPIIAAQMIFGEEMSLQECLLHYVLQEKYTTMWFLACLVMVNILAFILIKISDKNGMIFFFSLLLYLGGYAFTYIFGKDANLPWNLNTACVACLYFTIGYILKKTDFVSRVMTYGRTKGMCIFIVGIMIGEVVLHIIGKRYDMFYNQYGLFVISTLAAVLCTLGLINLVQNNNIPALGYIGKNSIVYFALHQMLFIRVFKMIFPSWKLLYRLIAMVLTIICITIISECINRTFLKYLIGKR